MTLESKYRMSEGIFMDIISWSQIVVICFLGAMSPGPSLALVIGNTMAGGTSYGIATSLGHAVGIGIWALLTAVGLAEVITGNQNILLVSQSLGSCFLAYIGFRSIFSREQLKVERTGFRLIHSKTLLRGVAEGFLVSILNPKIAVFFLAIFSHVIHSDLNRLETALIGLTAALVDAIWYVAVALVIMAPSSTRIFRDRDVIFRRFSGTILILVALYLFFVMIQDSL